VRCARAIGIRAVCGGLVEAGDFVRHMLNWRILTKDGMQKTGGRDRVVRVELEVLDRRDIVELCATRTQGVQAQGSKSVKQVILYN
jgi:hypothetical protein